jgi:membrane protease subunit HflC
MNKRPGILILSLLIVILFVAVQLFFVVREGEVVVVTFLGESVKAHTEAGLYMRKPWPFQKNYSFDNRLRTMDTVYEESVTFDQNNVLIGMYAAWRISNPIKFLQSVGGGLDGVALAESSLEDLIRDAKSQVLGKNPLSSLVSVNEEALQFEEMEAEILSKVSLDAEEAYGIAVTTIGIHRFGFPEGITESVFTRMREERNALAEGARAEGNKEASKIRAEAKRDSAKLKTQAEAQAIRAMAKADARALTIFDAFNEDPELAIFLNELKTLEKVLNNNATVIRTTDDAPFHLLNDGSGSATD